MRLGFMAAAALLAGCLSTPDAEIESASGDQVVVRVGPFAGLTEADGLAEQACGGRTAVIDRATREGDADNVYFTYRCLDRDWERLKARAY
jgi:hypothetical protein